MLSTRFDIPLLLIAALLCAAAAPATNETDLQRLQRLLRAQTARGFQSIPEVPGTYALTDICKLRIVDGRLALDVHPPESVKRQAQNCRLAIRGLNDFSVLSIQRNGDQLLNFSFTNINCSDAKALRIDTRIEYSLQQLSISRTVQMPAGRSFLNITLSQVSPEMLMLDDDQMAAGVRLFVNETRRPDKQIGEPSFALLRRNHPQDVQKYVRPLLRELGFDDLFDVDAVLARQVFRAEWPADPAMLDKAAKLLAAMNDNSFRRREAAVRGLDALGPDAVVAVLTMDRATFTPEQTTLVDDFLARHPGVAQKDAAALQTDREFLLDCLTSEEPRLRKIALAHLESDAGRKIEFDLSAGLDERRVAVAALRAMLTPASSRPTGAGE